MSKPYIYLASQSPRRAELLRQLGLRFAVIAVAADESRRPGEAPAAYVQRVTQAKIAAALAHPGRQEAAPLLAADTVVDLDGTLLGKPRGRDDALQMLARLSGREHRVLSCVALQVQGVVHQRLAVSRVRFRAITPAEAAAYWDTGEPAGKAGAYAIQGRGAVFVEHLDGSYSGVMGLPLFETAQLLRAAGMALP